MLGLKLSSYWLWIPVRFIDMFALTHDGDP